MSATTIITVDANAFATGPGCLRCAIERVCGTSGRPLRVATRKVGAITDSVRSSAAGEPNIVITYRWSRSSVAYSTARSTRGTSPFSAACA